MRVGSGIRLSSVSHLVEVIVDDLAKIDERSVLELNFGILVDLNS